MCKAASCCANNHESCFEAVKNIINLEIVEMSYTVNVYDSALPAWGTKYVSTANGKVFEKSLAILLSNNYSEITVESVKCKQQGGDSLWLICHSPCYRTVLWSRSSHSPV